MRSLPTVTDILIVGAGPTGLTLAAELKSHGAEPVIIDRLPVGANTSRACVVHARTMEVLEPLGATRDLLELGVKVPIFRIRDRDHTLITIDFSEIPSAYPFTLMCPQDRVERCLQTHLEVLGGTVLRRCEVVGIAESDRYVDVQVKEGDSGQTIRAQWLIGCDGMHSIVRTLADVRMQWPLSREEVTLFYSPAGLMVVAPLPEDHYRIVATVNQAPENPSSGYMQKLLDERGPAAHPIRVRDLVWSSRFRIHHRIAQSPRKGRVLLCGDSAHVHSPAGGQGMNTGIQDAVSLANTLPAVIKDGDTARLETWARERHQVAANVVTLTDRMTRLATMKSGAAQTVRNMAVAFAGHIPPMRAAFARTLAELEAR
jgi:2-polyprenyl-6-methoxyphenol hydroxylase-like FAD-dependent oxidoreductase